MSNENQKPKQTLSTLELSAFRNKDKQVLRYFNFYL